MPMPPTSPSPEKNEISVQQGIDVVKQEIEKAQQQGIQPATFVKLGDFALGAIKDKSLYPIFTKALVDNKIADQKDFKPGIDYQMLSHFAMLGKVAGQMGGMQ